MSLLDGESDVFPEEIEAKRKWGDAMFDRDELIDELGEGYAFVKYFDYFSLTFFLEWRSEENTDEELNIDALREKVDIAATEASKLYGEFAVDVLIYHFNKPEGERGPFEKSFQFWALRREAAEDGKPIPKQEPIYDVIETKYLQRQDIRQEYIYKNMSDEEVDALERGSAEREGLELYETVRISDPSLIYPLKELLDFWLITTDDRSGTQLFVEDCYSATVFESGVVYFSNISYCGTLIHAILFNKTKELMEVFLSSKPEKRAVLASALGKMMSVRGYLAMELALTKGNTKVLRKALKFMGSVAPLGMVLPNMKAYGHIIKNVVRNDDYVLFNLFFQTNELVQWLDRYLALQDEIPANEQQALQYQENAFQELWNSGTMLLSVEEFDAELLEVVAYETPLQYWEWVLRDIRTNFETPDLYLVLVELVLSHRWDYIAAAMKQFKPYVLNRPNVEYNEVDFNRLALDRVFEEVARAGNGKSLGKWQKKYYDLVNEKMKELEDVRSLEDYYAWLVKKLKDINGAAPQL